MVVLIGTKECLLKWFRVQVFKSILARFRVLDYRYRGGLFFGTVDRSCHGLWSVSVLSDTKLDCNAIVHPSYSVTKG